MTNIAPIANQIAISNTDQKQLVQTAQAFEAIFLRDMIKTMRTSGLGEDLFGNQGSEQFREMMDGQLADNMSETGNGLGIAEMLLAEWQKRL